jgi:hypothetical protein
MPDFAWNPVDFLDALEAVPIEGEFGTSYAYQLNRQGITLKLCVYPPERDVSIELTCGEQTQPVVSVQLLDCPAARVVQDKRGRYIEFAAANAFAGRYDETDAAPYGFRLWVSPFLQVEPYSYPS